MLFPQVLPVCFLSKKTCLVAHTASKANADVAAKKLRYNYLEVKGSSEQLIESIKNDESWSWARSTPQFATLVDSVPLWQSRDPKSCSGRALLAYSGVASWANPESAERARPGEVLGTPPCWSPQVAKLKTQVDSETFRTEYIAAGDTRKRIYTDKEDGSWDKGVHSFLMLQQPVDAVADASARLWRMHKAM